MAAAPKIRLMVVPCGIPAPCASISWLVITHKCQSEQNRIRSAELATKPEPVEGRDLAAL